MAGILSSFFLSFLLSQNGGKQGNSAAAPEFPGKSACAGKFRPGGPQVVARLDASPASPRAGTGISGAVLNFPTMVNRRRAMRPSYRGLIAANEPPISCAISRSRWDA